MRYKFLNYVSLAIQALCYFLFLNYLRTILHELGHGISASIIGVKFIGFYSTVFGQSVSFFSTSPQTAQWQNLVVGIGGMASDLILGLIIYFFILPKTKEWGPRLLWLFLSITTILAFWGYMFTGGLFGYGDAMGISNLLGINRLILAFIGLAGLIGFIFLLTRQIFGLLSNYFPLDTLSKRFGTYILFLGLPVTIYVLIGHIISHRNPLITLLTAVPLLVLLMGLTSLFVKPKSSSFQPLPKSSLISGFIGLIIACVVWLGAFGPTRHQAKGLLWGMPDENRVRMCNVTIMLNEDLTARIEFLMRSTTQPLIWEKLKIQPPNWALYTQFVQDNLPVMVGVNEYNIIEKVIDTTTPVYFRTREAGCRRITVFTNLQSIIQKNDEDTFSLEITDFWRIQSQSRYYLDRLEVTIDERMRIAEYKLVPQDAKKPDTYKNHKMIWENNNRNTPHIIHLTLVANENN